MDPDEPLSATRRGCTVARHAAAVGDCWHATVADESRSVAALASYSGSSASRPGQAPAAVARSLPPTRPMRASRG